MTKDGKPDTLAVINKGNKILLSWAPILMQTKLAPNLFEFFLQILFLLFTYARAVNTC